MGENTSLRARMTDRGYKQHELAEALNDALLGITGKRGTVSDRHIRNLLTGKTRRPQMRLRLAFETVFGCPAADLGFSAPPPTAPTPTEEDPMLRRTFCTAATGTVIAAAAPTAGAASGAPWTVGVNDAARLHAKVARLDSADHALGGTRQLETAALTYAERAITLVNSHSATTRVRSMLYAVASDAASTAAWMAIDGRRPQQAAAHLDRATALAGLSSNGIVQYRVWNLRSMLSAQQDRRTDALASAQAMRATTAARRDPLCASLAHSRAGLAHAALGEHTQAMRAFERARTTLDNAPEQRRPEWMTFYGEGEIDGLMCVSALTMGRPAEAEAWAHQALARLPDTLARNRALYHVELAFAQLRQGDDALAVVTARTAEKLGGTAPGSSRLRVMLDDFSAELTATSDSPAARGYTHHTYR
ncbi:hypothetical protein ACH427_16895 [Streptomyces sp. NPDC020379]|uniref:hypothetical protein n=1 Tax=Streptomyces sp. NPDC020379 TaxID=3365071 RepID=UPI003797CAF6